LDVFKNEPLKSSSQFWKLPNVTITPHVAGVTAIEPSVKYMYSKYKKLKKNKNIKSDVNPSDGY
jgi:phosphoglycerate dehydrogenase-like enzyme